MTNRDKINAMSNKKMADIILFGIQKNSYNDCCSLCPAESHCTEKGSLSCLDTIKEWLESEVKDEKK